MGIQNWSDDIVLVNLVKEPNVSNELQAVAGMVTSKGGFDVVIDFADVEIITSSSISKFLGLQEHLTAAGHHLVFSSVSPRVKKIFTVTGLDNIFNFVDDQFVALAGLQLAEC
jgi:anti-anti-sigma factor